MLELWVGTGLDEGLGWRHLLASGEARAGWDCVGPAGLVRRLGILFGVDTQVAGRGLRIQALDARLGALDDGARHYSRSREADPTGVAAHLIERCDELRLGGWDGRPLEGSARLAELSALGADGPGTPPGQGHCGAAVLAALEAARSLPIPMRLAMVSPRSHFAPLHARMLKRLAELGAEVVEGALTPMEAGASTGTDLEALQSVLRSGEAKGRALTGDGSVCLLEAETPWEAADLLGAYLADHPEPARTLIVPREGALLDAVLRRRGLPALGINARSRWRPALQVLPLRLALLFYPRDPGRALELLSLPVAPLPWRVKEKLIKALHAMPGVDGPEWRRAVEEAIREAGEVARVQSAAEGGSEAGAQAAAEEAEAHLRDAVARWFGGGGHGAEEGAPVLEAIAACRTVAQWARARAQGEGGEDAAFSEAAETARSLETMLGHLPPDARVPRLQLEQLHDLALGGGAAGAQVEAESGRPAVCSHPEGVLPADEIVWWGFDEQGAAAGSPAVTTAWTGEELAALQRQGVSVEPPGARRAREREVWHRAVFAAKRRLVLVRIRSAGGEPLAAHPLEDELTARLPKGALAACTITAVEAASGRPVALGGPWRPATEEVPAAPDVVPQPVWRLPAAHLEPRAPLSFTSVETFLGCPLKWAFTYVAGLRPGALGGLQEGSKLVGNFAHRLLQDLFFGDGAPDFSKVTPEEASAWTARAFDARVEGEAAPLLRPGYEGNLREAREQIARAAGGLVTLLKEGGWSPVAAEHPVSTHFAGVALEGRVDLLLQRKAGSGVIDLKLGKPQYRRDELREGRALQLALYAQGLATGTKAWPPTAYMTVGDARVMTTEGGFGSMAEVVPGASARETVQRAEEMWRWWRNVVGEGLVTARHEALEEAARAEADAVDGPPPEENPFAELSPPCRFCDFQTVCSARVARGAEVAA